MRKPSLAQKVIILWALISLLFVILRLFDAIGWSWFLVLFPFWVLPLSLGFLVLSLLIGVWFYDI